MNKIQLTAPYGRINMSILKRDDISFTQKLIFAVIAIKQGESEFAKLTQIMIADAVDCSTRYVSDSITFMEQEGLLERISKGKIHAIQKKSQYGMVELDMLITTNVTPKAKYLYLIYCATGNDYDVNIWGRKRICQDFHISNSTYHLAHRELVDKKILKVKGRSSGNGIQTSNFNYIIRTEKWKIERPPSWVPPEPFDLDKWCLEHPEPELWVQPEPELQDTPTGTMGTTQPEQRVQRTLTINTNLNSTPISSNLVRTNESFPTPIVPTNKELKIELLEEVIKRKFKTPEEVMKAIDLLNQNGFAGVAKAELDEEMIKKAFRVFEMFKSAIEANGKETFGFDLNIDDLNRFCGSQLSTGYSDEAIEYHIYRVVELGFETLNKPYIGFKYVINTDRGIHQEFKS